jgi:hypothetical protein
MFAALSAALVAALLSLGGASLVIADQPAGMAGDDHASKTDGSNGSTNGHSQDAADQGTQAPAATPAPAPVQDKSKGHAKHQSPPKQPTAPKQRTAPKKQSAPAPATQQAGGSHSTATSGPGSSSQGCDGTHHSNTGHGANQGGPYDNTCDGSPSLNGNGQGQATGRPCAGCVGNADDKNPKGQMPNGSDHNAGYECDRNNGIGRSNPAHTGCTTTETPEQPPATGQCTGDMSAGKSGNCKTQDDAHEGEGCAKLSSALSQAALVALQAVAAAHPEISKLSELAAGKVAGDCGNSSQKENGNGHTPVTICHATGSATNPYVEITIDENGLNGHGDHQDDRDIIPAPAEGCPQGSTSNGNLSGGGGTPEQPVTQTGQPVVTPENAVLPTTASGQTPATTPAPGQQQVLGVRENGTAPANTRAGRQEVLGENAAGGSAPASAVAPAAAQQAVRAGKEGGSLPFTGTDALLVLFLGCLLVLGGVTLQRVLARE